MWGLGSHRQSPSRTLPEAFTQEKWPWKARESQTWTQSQHSLMCILKIFRLCSSKNSRHILQKCIPKMQTKILLLKPDETKVPKSNPSPLEPTTISVATLMFLLPDPCLNFLWRHYCCRNGASIEPQSLLNSFCISFCNVYLRGAVPCSGCSSHLKLDFPLLWQSTLAIIHPCLSTFSFNRCVAHLPPR